MIAQDEAQRSQERAFGLQQQQLDKPPPAAPESPGKFAICTECHRQGLLNDDLYNADQWAWNLHIPPLMRKGYHWWAIPLSKKMRDSRAITALLTPIAVAWAKHMSFLVGKSTKDSLFGRLTFMVGKPVCIVLGKLKSWLEAK